MEAPAEDSESESEEKTLCLKAGGVSTPKKIKEEWLRVEYSDRYKNFIPPTIILSFLAYVCHFLANCTEDSRKNKYTQYHAAMNVAFFKFLAAHLVLTCLVVSNHNWGKASNKLLRRLIEPFTFCIRLSIVIVYVYFILWKTVICILCYKGYHAMSDNWWHSDTEAWITNASLFNAFLCWPVWLISLLRCFLFAIYGAMFCVSLLLLVIP